MRANVYIAVWALLILATVFELAIFSLPYTISMIILGIMGLAFFKAVLIALFYQHLLTEEGWVKLMYIVSLLIALGLITGMVTSIVR